MNYTIGTLLTDKGDRTGTRLFKVLTITNGKVHIEHIQSGSGAWYSHSDLSYIFQLAGKKLFEDDLKKLLNE